MNKKKLQLTSFLLLIALSSIPYGIFGQTNDWNVLTGGNTGRNGLTSFLGPLVEGGESPELYWSGGEESATAIYPAISGDNLLVSRVWPSDPIHESWIINYDLYSGEERWKITLPADSFDVKSRVIGISNDKVYAIRSAGVAKPGHICALDMETGDLVWKSIATLGEHNTEGLTFASNGDLIASDDEVLMRINHVDGTTIWQVPRLGSSSYGNASTVFGDQFYCWFQADTGMYVAVNDINTGELLYSSEALGVFGFQQTSIMVAPNGDIYAPYIRGNDFDSLFAFSNVGNKLIKKWTYPIGRVAFGNLGVGIDGSIYAYSRYDQVVRLDPETGEVINQSVILADLNNYFHPTIAIGDDGLVYVTIYDYPINKLCLLSQDLHLLWSEEIYGIQGIALGDSVLVVNGKDEIRAYKGRPNSPNSILSKTTQNDFSIYPNPAINFFTIESKDEIKNIRIHNQLGQMVKCKEANAHIIEINCANWKKGIYIVELQINGKKSFSRVIKN